MDRLQNRLTESRVELEKAVELDPNDAGTFLQLGITLLHFGEPEAALTQLKQALTPGAANSHFFYFWLGFAYELIGELDSATDAFIRARSAAPQIGGYHAHLAATLGLNDRLDEAKTCLAAAIELQPQASTIKQFLSRPGMEIGNLKFHELRQRTLVAGLLRAGMPAE